MKTTTILAAMLLALHVNAQNTGSCLLCAATYECSDGETSQLWTMEGEYLI